MPHLVAYGIDRNFYDVIHFHALYIEQKHLQASRDPSRLR